MQSGESVVNDHGIREIVEIILNVIILVLVGVGSVKTFFNNDNNSALLSIGLSNFKYFTVLSNIYCGIIAAVRICFYFLNKKMPMILKISAAASVGLTFLTIAAFFAPLYPNHNLYQGANLYFHLIVPLIAMLEFVILRTEEKIPFRYTLVSAAFSIIYGMVYLLNNLINGVGQWPDSNDWYGFLNWGYPVGIVIFAVIVLLNWLIAVILRFLNHILNKPDKK